LRGAEAAERLFALEEAADLLKLAIPRAPNERSRMWLVGRLGKVYLHMRDYDKARPPLESRLQYVRRRGDDELEEFRARRDVLFLDMWSSKFTVSEAAIALKRLYLDVNDSSADAPELKAQILDKLFWAAARSFDSRLVEETITTLRTLQSEYARPTVQCLVKRTIGIYECYRGRLDEAESCLRASLKYAEELEDQAAVVDAYIGLTVLLFRVMRLDLARHILKVALPLAEQLADPARASALLCNIAVCHMYFRDVPSAESLLRRARQVLKTSGSVPDTPPAVFYNLGFISHLKGDYQAAESHWKTALDFGEQGGVVPVQHECLAALGRLALERKQIPEARRLAARATRLARKGKFLIDERFSLEDLLARLRDAAGHTERALARLAAVATVARRSDIPLYLSTQLVQLELLIGKQRRREAKVTLKKLCDAAREHGASWWIEEAERVVRQAERGPRKRS
jgi:tetratricopeptide (TPR) repeat protein